MSDRMYVGTRKGLFTIERGGSGWRVARVDFLATETPMLLHDERDGALYAALGHGHFGAKLHRSDDGGATWTEITMPAYPEKPADAPVIIEPVRQKEVPWSVQMIWSLAPGGADQPGRLWCGTIPGGLFVSDDRGASWRLVDALWNHESRARWAGGGYEFPGIHSICVDPRDSRKITIGVSTGGAWRSDDDGATWRVCSHGMRADYMPPDQAHDPIVQDLHRMVRCPASPDHFWGQHHCGIFRSVDDCGAWSEVPNDNPSAFGFAVVVHPRDPETAWFVPAIKDELRVPVDGRVVVTRTRDGGASFQQLTRGLPGEHAYDLTYRHALDIDASGDRLAFGSTTGSLWVSEDQGDSWQTVSHHLPPIYCLQFAAR